MKYKKRKRRVKYIQVLIYIYIRDRSERAPGRVAPRAAVRVGTVKVKREE